MKLIRKISKIAYALLTKSWLKRLVLLCFLLPSVLAAHENDAQWRQQIAQRLQVLDAAQDSDWAYKVERLYKGDRYLLRYDGSQALEERWALLSVNVKAPSKKQRKLYQGFVDGWLKSKAQGEDESLLRMVPLSTLVLQSVDGEQALYRFKPVVDDLKDKEGVLQGHLWFAPKSQRISRLRIENTAQLSPSFSVKIKRFYLQIDFSVHNSCDVVSSTEIAVNGKLALIKSVDFEQTETYTEYRAFNKRCADTGA